METGRKIRSGIRDGRKERKELGRERRCIVGYGRGWEKSGERFQGGLAPPPEMRLPT